MPPTRYAVRQVLEQELHKEKMLQNSLASQRRSGLPMSSHMNTNEDKENANPHDNIKKGATDKVKRDFFGRVIKEVPMSNNQPEASKQQHDKASEKDRVWVSFKEGFSTAVRKPITLRELLDGF